MTYLRYRRRHPRHLRCLRERERSRFGRTPASHRRASRRARRRRRAPPPRRGRHRRPARRRVARPGEGQSDKFAHERNQGWLAVHGVAHAEPLRARVRVREGEHRGSRGASGGFAGATRRRPTASTHEGFDGSFLTVLFLPKSEEKLSASVPSSAASRDPPRPETRLRHGARHSKPLRREQRRGRARDAHGRVPQVARRDERAFDLERRRGFRFFF